jgi:hypothetical protein
MKKEFIPYTLALSLKELGFDEPCFSYYKNDQLSEILEEVINSKMRNVNNEIDDYISAPTFSQAFRWFREKYDLVHTVYSNASGYIWELHYNQERGGTHICDSGESGDCEMSGMFTTYEKAELECLKKLIEIVKENK